MVQNVDSPDTWSVALPDASHGVPRQSDISPLQRKSTGLGEILEVIGSQHPLMGDEEAPSRSIAGKAVAIKSEDSHLKTALKNIVLVKLYSSAIIVVGSNRNKRMAGRTNSCCHSCAGAPHAQAAALCMAAPAGHQPQDTKQTLASTLAPSENNLNFGAMYM